LISLWIWTIFCSNGVQSLGYQPTGGDEVDHQRELARTWEERMNMLNIRETLAALHREDSGQDLIEYALIAALIALAATVGMGAVATAINDAFSSIGEKLKTYTS
jgi:pilus assembly protein Flp/PilA